MAVVPSEVPSDGRGGESQWQTRCQCSSGGWCCVPPPQRHALSPPMTVLTAVDSARTDQVESTPKQGIALPRPYSLGPKFLMSMAAAARKAVEQIEKQHYDIKYTAADQVRPLCVFRKRGSFL